MLFDKITVTFGGIFIDIHRHMLGTQAEIHAVVFRYRHAHAQAAAQCGGFVLLRAGSGFARIIHAAVNIVAQAHAIGREIGVGKR